MKITSARITIIDPNEQFIVSYSDGSNTIRAKVKTNGGKFSVGTIQVYDPNSKNLPFEDDDQADEIKFDINEFLSTVSDQVSAFISTGKNGESKEITEGNEMKGQFEGVAKETYIGFVKKLMESAGDKALEDAVIGGFETIFEARERKTEDEYQIHGNYGHGWEEVTAESTMKDARAQLKTYRENEPGVSFKIVYKRVKKEEPKAQLEARERKTEDEYQIHGNYGHGWEEVTAESTMKDARAQLKTYRENEPGVSFKIVYKRVKKEEPKAQLEAGNEVPSDAVPVVFVKVTFDDGDFLKTSINGDLESAKKYYLGKDFTFGTGENDEVTKKAVDVELAD